MRPKCVDCGAEVVDISSLTRGSVRWGEEFKDGGFKAYCRITRDPLDDHRVTAIDWHYVEGEEQKHWRVP